MWRDYKEQAFQKIKQLLADQQVMVSLYPEKELLVYLIATEDTNGVLLAQE